MAALPQTLQDRAREPELPRKHGVSDQAFTRASKRAVLLMFDIGGLAIEPLLNL
ncbi:hypothetical protein AAW51_4064 [Caldimonas brevitalea]|uniref:Uncharacterized protein n=1 Tax=Caldimonas brevitalea TaxID=413882 RepID=A0A0G3BW50_9BURK|nr:hypothetical protein AAW51_4064 [Caldimonas brevitalea]